MRVECFEKDLRLEGDDLEALAAEFLTHFRAVHGEEYPDEDLLTYARNFGEATVRCSGPSERLAEIGAIDVHPVTAERIDDWLRLFDRDAFPDNPDWASCYCLEPHVTDDRERPWRVSRAEMIERLRSGATAGYLAYVDGVPAGWVNASTRAESPRFADVDTSGPDPREVVGVSCFVIAPPYRRHGLSSALLDRVIADAAARGARFVEAYPRSTRAVDDPLNFRGPRPMYDNRGFGEVEERERDTVLRLPVAE